MRSPITKKKCLIKKTALKKRPLFEKLLVQFFKAGKASGIVNVPEGSTIEEVAAGMSVIHLKRNVAKITKSIVENHMQQETERRKKMSEFAQPASKLDMKLQYKCVECGTLAVPFMAMISNDTFYPFCCLQCATKGYLNRNMQGISLRFQNDNVDKRLWN